MNVTYKKKFLKDLKALQSTEAYEKICDLVLEEIPNAEDLSTILQRRGYTNANLSKLKGDETAYRIRVGDYRIGFFMENDEIVMSRVLHRSEIYRYFP
jgi:mRNA interferase RelE/StbE